MALTEEEQQRYMNAGFSPHQAEILWELEQGTALTTTTAGVVVQSATVADPAALTATNQGADFADLSAATAAYNAVVADLTELRTAIVNTLDALKGTDKIMHE